MKIQTFCLLVVSLMVILAGACKKIDEKEIAEAQALQKVRDDEIIREYLTTNNIKTQKTVNGIYYHFTQLQPDSAAVEVGDTVSVHYTGTLLYGYRFDSSRFNDNDPFEFVLGTRQVILGWEEAVAMMKKGERAIFYMPSYLCYGGSGKGNIPPNSILVFDIEVIDFKKYKK